MKSPVDKLFWPLLGIAGLTTVFTGSAVSRYGVRSLLSVSLPLCGLSYSMLALASNNQWVILGSAVLFGATSIAPGTGFMVWGIRLFHERPSIGSGTVFFFQSVGTVMGPIVFGWIAPRVGVVPVFLAVGALSVVVLPFFPSRVFDTSAPRPIEAAEPATELSDQSAAPRSIRIKAQVERGDHMSCSPANFANGPMQPYCTCCPTARAALCCPECCRPPRRTLPGSSAIR
jgi:MFS family permease